MPSRRGSRQASRGGARHQVARRPPQTSPSSASTSPLTPMPINQARTRLPPRSRNGCWTCRNRKVKCDEGRPSCHQCSRLGHECDYSPRLMFKEQTEAVVGKYHRNRIWDPTRKLDTLRELAPSPSEDILLPFTSLSTDDEWQRKAVYRPPGTYYVVVNPASFQETDEYRPDSSGSSRPLSLSTDNNERRRLSAPNVPVDSYTLIVGAFEECTKRMVPGSARSSTSSSPTTSSLKSPISARKDSIRSADRPRTSQSSGSRRRNSSTTKLEPGTKNKVDPLQFQYRTVVRHHILQTRCPGVSIAAEQEDVFEKEAKHFPPLQHALMALSALSLAGNGRSQSVDALQHYEQALRPLQDLRSEQDLASNGAFLTHFILLLYEIAGTESFWFHHITSLSRILQIRQRIYDPEPYPYVVWLTCLIDINALLSGSGDGSFISQLMRDDMVPSAIDMRNSIGFLGHGSFFTGDIEIMTAAWELQREVALVAAKVGQNALRIRTAMSQAGAAVGEVQIKQWKGQVAQYRQVLKDTWQSAMRPELALAVSNETLGEAVTGIYKFALITYHLSNIYLTTTVWPTQRRSMQSNDVINDVQRAASLIISITADTVTSHQFEHRFVIFPLLVAGVMTSSAPDKLRAQNLMADLERTSLGSNTRATKQVLDTIHERQAREIMRVGHSHNVDLVEVMKEVASTLVNFGL